MRASVHNAFLVAAGHDVPYRDAVRCGDFVFVSGQVAMDYATDTPIHPDVAGQSATGLRQVEEILGHFDLSLEHVVSLHSYFPAGGDRAAQTAALRRQAERLGPNAAGAVKTVSRLVRPDLLNECDAIAVAPSAERRASSRRSYDGCFPAAVSAGPLVFISGHAAPSPVADPAAELRAAMASVAETLGELGIGTERIVKLTVQTTGPAAAAAVEALLPSLAPNAAVTDMVVPSTFLSGRSIALDGVAVTEGEITRTAGAVTCTATPLVFLEAHRAPDAAGKDLLAQTAGVMEAISATMTRCGASTDALVKHQLFYVEWGDWTQSVAVRARYVREPLAALGIGAGSSDPAALIQSDAVAFIEGSES